MARHYRVSFVTLLGIAVGVVAGLVAEALLRAINFISNAVYFGRISSAAMPPTGAPFHYWLVLLPAIGGLAVGLIAHYFCPEVAGDGIPEAMSVVLKNRSVVKPSVGILKPLTAAITVGTGGPFGAEGPILQTGGALGSLLSMLFPCTPAERRTLLACGAAAGLAAVFKTPFAAALMSVELLVCEFRTRSFLPITLSSIVGTLMAMAFRGTAVVFPVDCDYHLHALELPFFVLLGLLCAGAAWLMKKTLYGCEEFIEHRLKRWWFPAVPAAGGLCVGLLALWHPEVLGTGYSVIADLLARPHPLHELLGIGTAKLIAFSVALGSGASGGTFAPALMIGGSLGAAFGSVVHLLIGHSSATIGLYGMVATAALFGSLYRATPSAVLFMLEVTGAFNALLPLLIVGVVAALVMHYISETSINTERLVRRGQLVPEAYTVDPMRLHRVSDVMSADIDTPAEQTVHADEILHDIIPRLLHTRSELCAVLDRNGQRVGTLTVLDILSAHKWEYSQEIPEPGLLQFGKWAAPFGLSKVEESV